MSKYRISIVSKSLIPSEMPIFDLTTEEQINWPMPLMDGAPRNLLFIGNVARLKFGTNTLVERVEEYPEKEMLLDLTDENLAVLEYALDHYLREKPFVATNNPENVYFQARFLEMIFRQEYDRRGITPKIFSKEEFSEGKE